VRAVTSFLFGHGCDIVEHQQFDDAIRGKHSVPRIVAGRGSGACRSPGDRRVCGWIFRCPNGRRCRATS
jgi:hypothetical protein